MQPYFFPYLGYFSLIHSIHNWIVFDISQYTRKTWINRNKLLHPSNKWQYISIPLEHSTLSMRICDARIRCVEEVKLSLLGKLSAYKKVAPYYQDVVNIVSLVFDRVSSNSLVELNVSSIKVICEYLGINFNYRLCSELSIDIPGKMNAGDWAPLICKHVNATSYVNPISGSHLFNKNDFLRNNIELNYLEFTPEQYYQNDILSSETLSTLDVLLWNSKSEILDMIERCSKLIEINE